MKKTGHIDNIGIYKDKVYVGFKFIDDIIEDNKIIQLSSKFCKILFETEGYNIDQNKLGLALINHIAHPAGGYNLSFDPYSKTTKEAKYGEINHFDGISLEFDKTLPLKPKPKKNNF